MASPLTHLLWSRSVGLRTPADVADTISVRDVNIRSLHLRTVLDGHTGCVNRISWNERGDALLSGSDDTNLILWTWEGPAHHTAKIKTAIVTGHTQNIFGARFVPGSGDTKLASCAMDGSVRVHDLCGGSGTVSTLLHKALNSRIKNIDVCPSEPFMLWHAEEKGVVGQHDLRVRDSRTALLATQEIPCGGDAVGGTPSRPRRRARVSAFGGSYPSPDLTNVAINRAEPHYLATASADRYVRVYDRRKLPTPTGHPGDDTSVAGRNSSFSGYNTPDPAMLFSPLCLSEGQDPEANAAIARSTLRSTYAEFSLDGRSIVSSYQSVGVYVFNMHNAASECITTPEASFIPPQRALPRPVEGGTTAAPLPASPPLPPLPSSPPLAPAPRQPMVLCVAADRLKCIGNEDFRADRFAAAARRYTDAIAAELEDSSDPSGNPGGLSMLYSNRASANLKLPGSTRLVEALYDAEHALKLNPNNAKAAVWRAQALLGLHRYTSAKQFAVELVYSKDPICLSKAKPLLAQINKKLGLPAGDVTLPCQGSSDWNYCLVPTSTQLGSSRVPCITRTEGWFSGHRNYFTDIKEAVFWGGDGARLLGRKGRGAQGRQGYIVGGSDCGHAFIWDRASTRLVATLNADSDVLNCVQPNPTRPWLATSGIESVVRIWQPAGALYASSSGSTYTGDLDDDTTSVDDEVSDGDCDGSEEEGAEVVLCGSGGGAGTLPPDVHVLPIQPWAVDQVYDAGEGPVGGSADAAPRRAVTSRRVNERLMTANEAPPQDNGGCTQQ